MIIFVIRRMNFLPLNCTYKKSLEHIWEMLLICLLITVYCCASLSLSCIIIYETVDWYFSFFDNAKSEWMNVLIYINFYFWLHASISLVAASEISIFKHRPHQATPATDKKEEKNSPQWNLSCAEWKLL